MGFSLFNPPGRAVATFVAMSPCTAKMSSRSSSYFAVQRCSSVATSITWTVTRIRLADLRTLPSTTVPTPSSFPIVATDFSVFL